MDENAKIMIIPDVHGRDFWRTPVMDVLENSDIPIVFLGDYLDPYYDEWRNKTNEDPLFDYRKHALDVFEDIIQLKNQYHDRIILLLGDHDCSYAVEYGICCSCRYDEINSQAITDDFFNNLYDFQLAYETTINGKHFIFSHAGISRKYAEKVFGKDVVTEDNVVDLFNSAWEVQSYGVLDSLGMYDYYRGGFRGNDYASLVWADIHEWGNDSYSPQEGYGYLIFGHTQLVEQPYIDEKFACLDCRKAFYIDSDGNIKEYNTTD